jgi:Protein of unknown function (DUF2752)
MPPLQNALSNSVAMSDRVETPDYSARCRANRQTKSHLIVLTIACAVWLLAFVLHELPDERVAVRGLPQIPLPQTCASRTLLGLRCPGCGLTRSIIHLAEGDWRASWHDHRLGGLFAIVIALQIPYRFYALCRPERPPLAIRWQIVLAYALVALLFGNWLLDVAAGRLSSP